MKNGFKNKRNILMIMFALVVIMGIGFAAYSQRLIINETSSIDSNWDVYIKKAVAGTKEGGATGEATVKSKTEANLVTNLKYPGDYVIYTITVANDGSIDAILEAIDLKAAKQNTVVKYSYVLSNGTETTDNEVMRSEIEELNAGEIKEFSIKVAYDSTMTGTATEDQKSNTLTLNLDYVQKGTSGGTITPSGKSVVYSKNIVYEESDYINVGDSLDKITGYAEDYTTLNSDIFLKHNMNNNVVESNEVCFIHNGLHCLRPNEYETSKASLLSIFGESSCTDYTDTYRCYSGMSPLANAYKPNISYNPNSVNVRGGNSGLDCFVYTNGSSMCGPI